MWEKLGLIYGPNDPKSWASNSSLTPTPFLHSKKVIRVYAGFRDTFGISRIGYVDVCAEDPTRLLRVSQKPVLDLGVPGTFDDNGVMPGEVIRVGSRILMYYTGFQLTKKIKFQAFTGLCESFDNGETFTRVQKTPVLDRAPEALHIRTLHTAIYEQGLFKVWYVGGSEWIQIGGKDYASYKIFDMESSDGISFGPKGRVALNFDAKKGEYRIGRPRVNWVEGQYQMTFTFSDVNGVVNSGYATSKDGKVWIRDDPSLGIIPSSFGWDSESINYPYRLTAGDNTYLFYCGKNLGFEGFGCARLKSK